MGHVALSKQNVNIEDAYEVNKDAHNRSLANVSFRTRVLTKTLIQERDIAPNHWYNCFEIMFHNLQYSSSRCASQL